MNRFRKVSRCLAFLALSLYQTVTCAVPREVALYTYHDMPPYVVHSHGMPEEIAGGIYAALAKFLNAEQSRYRFAVTLMPRRRLDQMLNAGEIDGGIVGVNPAWFKDKERSRYLWTSSFMVDRDIIAVSGGKAFPYKVPRDLIGKTMALPRGFYYSGVTELAGEGKIALSESSNELQCLRMVQAGRADATIVSQLTFNYYAEEQAFPGAMEALEVPHDSFERMILLPKSEAALFNAIQTLFHSQATMESWRKILRKYAERKAESVSLQPSY